MPKPFSAALALSLAGLGCSTGCPDPVLANPATATWSGDAVVVRWSPSPADRLPDAYYAEVMLGAPPQLLGLADAGALVESVKLTGSRELTLATRDLEGHLKASRRLEVDLGFPDQRHVVKCSHPGMGDAFAVTLTLDFDPAAHTALASFGELRDSRGACTFAGAPADGGAIPIAMLVVLALAAYRRSAAARAAA